MREILFRGKRKDNEEWVYGSLLIQSGEWINKDELAPTEYRILGIRGENHLVIPETVGQYTGLSDKNGRNIFDGDVVRVYDPLDDPEDCVVSWSKEGARWNIGGCDAYLCTPSKNCEIIGTIFDNPELLEGNKT